MFRCLFVLIFLFFALSSNAIYNFKTNEEAVPKINSKNWILVAQGCHSCSELLNSLKTFCSGKKPDSSKLGFFITGSSAPAMFKKLADFKASYEIFSGSPNEFYAAYQIMGSPSLRAKNNKIIVGKDKILKYLKKDSQFCSA